MWAPARAGSTDCSPNGGGRTAGCWSPATSTRCGRALTAATADGAVWGCRAGTFATLFGRARELAGLAEAERRDGLALRCAITEALDPPGAGHVAALERLILELRGARASPAAFTAAAEATGSPPLRTAARVYQAVADIPSPDAPEWETVDAAASVEIGPLYLVGFDDYAPVEWALLRALASRNPIAAGLAYEQGRRVFAARHDRVAAWTADAETTNWHPPPMPIGGIGSLERRLFEPGSPAAAEGVEWLEAAGTDVCHRMAAERVVAALRAGTPPDRIAVVAPRLFEHLSGLRSALAEAGVASRHRVRRPFAASPLARALVSLFAFALDEDGPESIDRLVAWLRSPYSGADDRRGGHVRGRHAARLDQDARAADGALAGRGDAAGDRASRDARRAAAQPGRLPGEDRPRAAGPGLVEPAVGGRPARRQRVGRARRRGRGAARRRPPPGPRRRPARPARRALGRPRVRRAVRTGGRRRAARPLSGPRPCLRRGDRAGARGRDVAGSSRARPVSARRPARPARPAAAARARYDRGAAALPRRLRLRDRAIDARAPVRRRRRPRARALALLGRDAPAAGRVRADSAWRHRPRAGRRRRRQRARPRPPARARAPPGASRRGGGAGPPRGRARTHAAV